MYARWPATLAAAGSGAAAASRASTNTNMAEYTQALVIVILVILVIRSAYDPPAERRRVRAARSGRSIPGREQGGEPGLDAGGGVHRDPLGLVVAAVRDEQLDRLGEVGGQ